MQMLKAKTPAPALERGNNHIRTSELIDDDSEEEIIKRLPIKKVFECMSISKHWLSRILSPAFTEVYRRQHPCYLLMNANDKNNHRCFYHSPLLVSGDMKSEAPEEFVKSFTADGDHETIVTKSVHGFFCVFNYTKMCLSMYNVWRGEIMKLPYPLVSERTEWSNPPDFFYFGFEPVNGVYKLLKVTSPDKHLRYYAISRDLTSFDCQIATMDCNNKSKFSWRKLHQSILDHLYQSHDYLITLSFFSSQLFSVDGFLFWHSPILGLISFDLKEEKFFVVNPPTDLSQQDFNDSLTTQFRGQLALFMHNPVVDEKLILCTLTIQQLDDNQEDYTYSWTKHFISLPSGLHDRYLPVGNLPTGEMLLSNLDTKDPFTVVYAYNHETRSFQRFISGKLKMDFDTLKDQPKRLVNSVCCVQPSFSIQPDAFGECFSSGDLDHL